MRARVRITRYIHQACVRVVATPWRCSFVLCGAIYIYCTHVVAGRVVSLSPGDFYVDIWRARHSQKRSLSAVMHAKRMHTGTRPLLFGECIIYYAKLKRKLCSNYKQCRRAVCVVCCRHVMVRHEFATKTMETTTTNTMCTHAGRNVCVRARICRRHKIHHRSVGETERERGDTTPARWAHRHTAAGLRPHRDRNGFWNDKVAVVTSRLMVVESCEWIGKETVMYVVRIFIKCCLIGLGSPIAVRSSMLIHLAKMSCT